MKRSAATGESAKEAKKIAGDSPLTMDIELICDAIPGFLRLLANYFSHAEKMHVLSLVSKAWKAAMPLYLPVKKNVEAVHLFLKAFIANPNSYAFWNTLPIPNDFLHVLEECDVRMWNVGLTEEGMEELRERERLNREATARGARGSGRGLHRYALHHKQAEVRVRVRPDASCVVSLDLEQKHMELSIETTPGFHFQCHGTIVGWAKRRVHHDDGLGDLDQSRRDLEGGPVFAFETLFDEDRALQSGDPLTGISTELPGAPKDAEEWQYHAIVDVGIVRLSEYTDNAKWEIESELVVMPGRRAEELYHRLVEREVDEGVVYVDNALSGVHRGTLMAAIERLRAAQGEPDYHPHSDNKVRDLVHPALFAYVAGESPFFGSQDLPVDAMAPHPLGDKSVLLPTYGRLRQRKERDTWRPEYDNSDYRLRPKKECDMWGREYEDSNYQWLPTYFNVASDCKVHIEDYINGISRAAHPELYAELEALFERFVPLLEHAWTYGVELRFQERYDHIGWNRPVGHHEFGNLSPLRGSRLQIITKIVDYELQPGQEHEGAWHVEGMSHESIVATALYIAARDEGIQGGKLCFKRALEEWEGGFISEIHQYPFRYVYDFIRAGMLPLGELETPDNRMLVFPNSHVHKVMKMVNAGDQLAKRRIVVFFLVNPLVRIVSTKEVPDQRRTMSLERAKEHRLELMKERRLHKQDWNVREVGLCEH